MRKMLGVVLVLALGAAAAFAASHYQERQQLHAASSAAGAFRACLYGEPLKEGETPKDRLVAIELCAKAPSSWPRSCRAELRGLLDAFDQLEVSEEDPRFGAARKHARVAVGWEGRDVPWLAGIESSLIQDLENGLARADLPAVPQPSPRAICASRPLFDATSAVSLGATDGYRGMEERVRGQALRVAWPGGPGKQSLACWFAPSGDPVARCGAPQLPIFVTLLNADESLRDVYIRSPLVGDSKRDRVVDQQGTTIAELSTIRDWGWARSDGSVVVAGFDGVPLLARAGAVPQPSSGWDKRRGRPGIRPGLLLWQDAADPAAKSGHVKLQAQRLGGKGALMGEPFAIGSLPRPGVGRTCRAPNGDLTLAFVGRRGGLRSLGSESLTEVDVTMFLPDGSGAYRPPVHGWAILPWAGGVFEDVDGRATFGCSPAGLPRWLWFRGNTLHELRCGAAGCQVLDSGPLELPISGLKKMAVSPLADREVLLVYEGASVGPIETLLHAVRARVAPLSALAKAPDQVLLTEPRHGGLKKLWEGVFAFGRGPVGWAAVRADRHIYAFRTGVDGRFSPVTLAPR